MRFKSTRVFRQERFAVGVDQVSGKYFLSIPVSNRLVDYQEYYTISSVWGENPELHLEELKKFAEECRHQELDQYLILKPGFDRGVAE